MLKLKTNQGENKVIPLNKGIAEISLPKDKQEEKRIFTFKIEGLPLESKEIDGINGLIRDLQAQEKINVHEISNGNFTFEQLYKIIDDRERTINDLRILINNYEQTK